MKAREKEAMADTLVDRLEHFDRSVATLVGVRPFENRQAFAWQLIDSLQRIAYVSTMVSRRHRMSP
ncbi:hypothetical protein NL351_30700, partial [Klebsiella pneumoniae]|nr:hypothetical protein [Klebsiella pneumoniae]